MRHTINIIIAALIALAAGCSKDGPTAAPVRSLSGTIVLVDSSGMDEPNMSGVKVTILSTMESALTDSTGNFTMNGIRATGTVDLKVEYGIYPAVTVRTIALNNGATVLGYLHNDLVSIGPPTNNTGVIDSMFAGPSGFAAFLRMHSPQGTRYFLYFGVLTKYAADAQTTSGPGIVFSGMGGSIFLLPGRIDSTFMSMSFGVNRLKEIGFQPGDSLWLRIYPVGRGMFDQDPSTKEFTYYTKGKGSNIVGVRLQ